MSDEADEVTPPPIEKHQVWRRRKTGKLVRVVQAVNLSKGGEAPYYDVHWETLDRPYRRGASYEDYWRRNCELVEDEDTDQERWAATVAPEWLVEDNEESEET